MTKKLLAILISALFMLASLSGCFNNVDDVDDPGPPPDLNVSLPKDYACELQLAYRQDPAEEELIDLVIAGFNVEYPNIKIKKVPVNDYEMQVVSDFGAGNYYDVFWVADNSASTFAEDRMMQDLKPYVEASKFDLDLYYPSMIKLGYRDHDPDKALLMLPRDFSNAVVFINEDRFAEVGVPVPTNKDWTWDDFATVCKAVADGYRSTSWKDERYALDANFEWTILFYSLLKSFGGANAKIINAEGYSDWGNADAKGPSYEAAAETISQIKDLFSYGCLTLPEEAWNGRLFETNKAAMYLMSRPHLVTIKSLPMHLKVLPFPGAGVNPSSGAGTTGYAIARGSREKNAAWALLSYMMSREGQEAFSKSGGAVPALIELAESANAEWRKIKDYYGRDIDHDAFIYKANRCIVNDYYDAVPAKMHLAYNGRFVEAVESYWNGKSGVTLESCIKTFTTNISRERENWD